MFIKDIPDREKSGTTSIADHLIESYDFGGAVLLDAGGNPGIAVPPEEAVMGEYLRGNVTKAISNPVVSLSGVPHCLSSQLPSSRPAHPDENAL